MSAKIPAILVCVLAVSGCGPTAPNESMSSSGASRSPSENPTPVRNLGGPTASMNSPSETSLSLPVPVSDLKPATNLITDPSLEETSVGDQFPPGWGQGNLVPPGTYTFSVSDGGRTGQHGWRVKGDGQYAVIPTNRPEVDRGYRYGGRGWVRLESGGAQLKILYFDESGRYIGENRGPVMTDQGEWQQLTMADDHARFPEARHLSLALSLVGTGEAVFDDLEFTAFDAEQLPQTFDTEFASSRKHDLAVFDRWVGRWESVTEYKPTATTEARTVKGETVVRKVLDDRFLLGQWTSEAGDLQYLSLLGFDENAGSYRFWLFSSLGEVYERTGQWDAASQTLNLVVKPPSPGVTGNSTDRFVNDDTIESTLLVRNAQGEVTRDVHMTSVRKAADVDSEIVLSSGPATDDEELAILQKFAGNWTIQSTAKPSVWQPDGRTETLTEQVDWINGGRFLMFRTWNDSNRLMSLSLMTHEPMEASYHFWYFDPAVNGGQWRITWDAADHSFHWRSIDMPTGWIGTGLNRWIDDDTLDNEALIKDEHGRVLLNTTQNKRRKK